MDSTLLLYTDGLLEQCATGAGERARSTDGRTVAGRLGARDLDRGLTRLTGLLADSADLDLESLCDRVMATLVPAGGAADDVALIAVRPYAEDRPRPAQAGPNVLP